MSETELEIDAVDGLVVKQVSYANEITAMATLQKGLFHLFNDVANEEDRIADKHAAEGMGKAEKIGWCNLEEQQSGMLMACRFHWFGMTLCNYVRLIGLIRGLEQKEFSRDDFLDITRPKQDKIRKSIKGYFATIPQIEPVVIWRNKVFGHIAMTDPYPEDNVATLARSLMVPAEYSRGRFRAGAWQVVKKNDLGTFESQLPEWSLTEVFEALAPRYWAKKQSPPTESTV